MIIRMTEDKWINFDNVKKIAILDQGKLKIFFSGQRNSDASFYLKNRDEAAKVANEITAAISLGKIGSANPNETRRNDQGPLIKNGKIGVSYG